MKIAITGGTGFVGQALIDRADADGVLVQALARKPQAGRDGIEWIAGDVNHRLDTLDQAGKRIAVGQVAGLTNAPWPTAMRLPAWSRVSRR
jgi:uncharacterized protein YbjT (DUF2867 family)